MYIYIYIYIVAVDRRGCVNKEPESVDRGTHDEQAGEAKPGPRKGSGWSTLIVGGEAEKCIHTYIYKYIYI